MWSVNDIVIAGHYLYIAYIIQEASGARGGVQVIDVMTPATPVAVGDIDTPGPANDLAITGHYLYVAAGSAGVRVIDIANPTAPVEVGVFGVPWPI